jgi:uncharacterized membrane protein
LEHSNGIAAAWHLPYVHQTIEDSTMRIPVKQSLVKTGTFAVVHFIVAFAVAYALTGSAPIASAIALLEPLANTVAYFFHERAWARLSPPAPAAAAIAER